MHRQSTLNRSQAAFVLSCERLFSLKKPVYFWTFTFVETLDEWEYGKRWHDYLKALSRAHGMEESCMTGLRVIEPHEGNKFGESHGLHYHCLWTKRLSVHIARRVGRRFGVGRVAVERADRGAIFYLVPYLGKSKKFATRIRTWAATGGFLACKVGNVVKESPYHRNMRRLYRGKKVGFAKSTFVLDQSKRHGEFENWPDRAQKFAGEHEGAMRGPTGWEASAASGPRKLFYDVRQTLPSANCPF